MLTAENKLLGEKAVKRLIYLYGLLLCKVEIMFDVKFKLTFLSVKKLIASVTSRIDHFKSKENVIPYCYFILAIPIISSRNILFWVFLFCPGLFTAIFWPSQTNWKWGRSRAYTPTQVLWLLYYYFWGRTYSSVL